MQGEPVSDLLKRYVQQLYGPIVGKLGWESKGIVCTTLQFKSICILTIT